MAMTHYCGPLEREILPQVRAILMDLASDKARIESRSFHGEVFIICDNGLWMQLLPSGEIEIGEPAA